MLTLTSKRRYRKFSRKFPRLTEGSTGAINNFGTHEGGTRLIQADGSAPYAPPKSLMDVIQRYRDKGLQTPFDLGVLGRAGISSGLAPRVLQALRLLDLTDPAGNPTTAFESLRRAPSDAFNETLAEVVRNAYGEVFNYVDPAEDSIEAISDAFRSYSPSGQRDRMVTLFMGLCREAGIVTGKVAPRSSKKSRPEGVLESRGRHTSPNQTIRRPRSAGNDRSIGDLPPQLTGLLRTLPDPEDGWSSERRDQFIAAFSAIIDYTYPVREQLPTATLTDGLGGQI
jgi:hypothetical protein